MINFTEIEKEVINIETSRDTSYATIERLAPLYIALLYNTISGQNAFKYGGLLEIKGESEFLKAINGKDGANIWPIIDELISTIRILQPNVYESIMSKINSIE